MMNKTEELSAKELSQIVRSYRLLALQTLRDALNPMVATHFDHLKARLTEPTYVRNLKAFLNTLELAAQALDYYDENGKEIDGIIDTIQGTLGEEDSFRYLRLARRLADQLSNETALKAFDILTDAMDIKGSVEFKACPATMEFFSLIRNADPKVFDYVVNLVPKINEARKQIYSYATNQVNGAVNDLLYEFNNAANHQRFGLSNPENKLDNNQKIIEEVLDKAVAKEAKVALANKDSKDRYVEPEVIATDNENKKLLEAYQKTYNALDYLQSGLSADKEVASPVSFFYRAIKYAREIDKILEPITVIQSAVDEQADRLKKKIQKPIIEFVALLDEAIVAATKLEVEFDLRPGYFFDHEKIQLRKAAQTIYGCAQKIGLPLSQAQQTLMLEQRQRLFVDKYQGLQKGRVATQQLKEELDAAYTILNAGTPIANMTEENLKTLLKALPKVKISRSATEEEREDFEDMIIGLEIEIEDALNDENDWMSKVWFYSTDKLDMTLPFQSVKNHIWRVVKEQRRDVEQHLNKLKDQIGAAKYERLYVLQNEKPEQRWSTEEAEFVRKHKNMYQQHVRQEGLSHCRELLEGGEPLSNLSKEQLTQLYYALPSLGLSVQEHRTFENLILDAMFDVEEAGESDSVISLATNLIGKQVARGTETIKNKLMGPTSSRQLAEVVQEQQKKAEQIEVKVLSLPAVEHTAQVINVPTVSEDELIQLSQEIADKNFDAASTISEFKEFLLGRVDRYFVEEVSKNLKASKGKDGLYKIKEGDPKLVQDMKAFLSALSVLEHAISVNKDSAVFAFLQLSEIKNAVKGIDLDFQQEQALYSLMQSFYSDAKSIVVGDADEEGNHTPSFFEILLKDFKAGVHLRETAVEDETYLQQMQRYLGYAEKAFNFASDLQAGEAPEDLQEYVKQIRDVEDQIEAFMREYLDDEANAQFVRTYGLYSEDAVDSALVINAKRLLNTLHHAGTAVEKAIAQKSSWDNPKIGFLSRGLGVMWHAPQVVVAARRFLKSMYSVDLPESYKDGVNQYICFQNYLQNKVDNDFFPRMKNMMMLADKVQRSTGLKLDFTNGLQDWLVDPIQTKVAAVAVKIQPEHEDAFQQPREQEQERQLQEVARQERLVDKSDSVTVAKFNATHGHLREVIQEHKVEQQKQKIVNQDALQKGQQHHSLVQQANAMTEAGNYFMAQEYLRQAEVLEQELANGSHRGNARIKTNFISGDVRRADRQLYNALHPAPEPTLDPKDDYKPGLIEGWLIKILRFLRNILHLIIMVLKKAFGKGEQAKPLEEETANEQQNSQVDAVNNPQSIQPGLSYAAVMTSQQANPVMHINANGQQQPQVLPSPSVVMRTGINPQHETLVAPRQGSLFGSSQNLSENPYTLAATNIVDPVGGL